jgi:hypothetical protein
MTARNQLIIGFLGLILVILITFSLRDSKLPSVPFIGFGCYSGSIYNNYVSDYTSGWGRNQMQAFGIDVIDAQGNQLTIAEFSELAYRVLSSQTAGGGLSKSEIDTSYQPGFGLYNFLNGVFTDPDIAYSVKEGMKCAALN